MWIIWSVLASVMAIFIEYSYRNKFDSFLESLPYLIIPIIILQFGIFKLFNGTPHWLLGWSIFFFVNAVGRVAVSYWSGEQLNFIIISGIVVVAIGALIISLGKV